MLDQKVETEMDRHHHKWENGTCACGKLQCQAYVLRSPQRSTLCRAARQDGSLFCSNHQYVRTAPIQKAAVAAENAKM